jgi:hypothetical protein
MPVRLTLCLGGRVRPTPAAGGFGRFLAHELESQPVDLSVHALERHLAGDPAELIGPDEDDEVVITTLDITP